MAVNNRMNRGCGWPTALCIQEVDAQTAWGCYTAGNFRDANNWTFSVTRDTSTRDQSG